jgi:pimeloyl-ACP methyl ester carboxylesterase
LKASARSRVRCLAQNAPLESTSATTTYRWIRVDGVNIFYREAGDSSAPTIVLLHGFPSSSREYDSLIPLLATHYHIVAPDFPGLGKVRLLHRHRMHIHLIILPQLPLASSINLASRDTRFICMTMADRSDFA